MELPENLKIKRRKASVLQSRRTENSTKRNYAGNIAKLRLWLMENWPEAIDTEKNDIIVPIDVDIIMCFFGDIVDKEASRNALAGNEAQLDEEDIDEEDRDLPPIAQIAVSTIGSYRSALKDSNAEWNGLNV